MTPRRRSKICSWHYISLQRRSKSDTDAVGFDNAHLVAINPKVERGKRADVHNAESIRLARFKRKSRVLVKADMGSDRGGVFPRHRT